MIKNSPNQHHDCPVCNRSFPVREGDMLRKTFPFCTRRCQTIDLGRWFQEDYRILRPATLEDLADAPSALPEDPSENS
ncbi:MAG: DNA gyrase inhibitor YacG [Planctomycetota bacterium]|nr:DNA gyrase inhibitor YacG [Planctomycetota bacterium]